MKDSWFERLIDRASPTRLPLPAPTWRPLPTLRPTPIPSRARRTALPTPWPLRVNLSSVKRVGAKAAALSFMGANITALLTPEGIQGIQASLACTLRMPLENVRIQALTRMIAGVQMPVFANPEAVALSSNGSAICMRPLEVPNATVQRRLQAAGGSAVGVIVDYTLVDPPLEVLALNDTEFAAVVAMSPELAVVAQVVGAAGVDAINYDVGAGAAAAPVPASASETSQVGGIIGGAVSAFVIIVAVLSFLVARTVRRRRQQRRRIDATAARVNPVVVVRGGAHHPWVTEV